MLITDKNFDEKLTSFLNNLEYEEGTRNPVLNNVKDAVYNRGRVWFQHKDDEYEAYYIRLVDEEKEFELTITKNGRIIKKVLAGWKFRLTPEYVFFALKELENEI